MAVKHRCSAIYLPDDIILEVLSRLPTPHLYRCKCVSKQWRQSLVPSILVRRPTIAFFLNQYGGNKSSIFTFSNIGGPILDHYPKELALGTIYDNPRVSSSPVLSVCNGAVLFLLKALGFIKCALYNPFTGKTSIIKLSPFANEYSDPGFLFLAFDHRISSQHFNAVSMIRGSSHGYLYSSRTRKWKLLKSIDAQLSSWRMIDSYNYCVNGKAYKLVYNNDFGRGISDCILAFDIKEECLSMIVSPTTDLSRNNPTQRSILGEIAGSICYAFYDSMAMSMRIWALCYANGSSEYSWDLRHNVKLHAKLSPPSPHSYINLHFHPIDDEVIFVLRFGLDIYLYNFKSSELRPATQLYRTNIWITNQFFSYLAPNLDGSLSSLCLIGYG